MSKDFWPNGKKCAVSLTYDDALPVHHESISPALERNGLRGTFYVPVLHSFHEQSLFMKDVETWKEIAKNGHELGNHTLFHPCREGKERIGLAEHYYLDRYTIERMEDELSVANFVLQLVDGKECRTYGNTCCDVVVGEQGQAVSINDVVEKHFVAGRGPWNEHIFLPNGNTDLSAIGHFSADGKTCEEVQEIIDTASNLGGWVVFMVHGVGDRDHHLNMDWDEHMKLVDWLGERKNEIWTAPVVDVATFVKSKLNDQE